MEKVENNDFDMISENPNLNERDKRKDIFIKTLGMLDYSRFVTLKRYHNTVISYDDYNYALEYMIKVVKAMNIKINKKLDDLYTFNFLSSYQNFNEDALKAMENTDNVKKLAKDLLETTMSKLVGFQVYFRYIKPFDEHDYPCYILEDTYNHNLKKENK